MSENFLNEEIKFPVLGGSGCFLLSKEFSSEECNRVFRFETLFASDIRHFRHWTLQRCETDCAAFILLAFKAKRKLQKELPQEKGIILGL